MPLVMFALRCPHRLHFRPLLRRELTGQVSHSSDWCVLDLDGYGHGYHVRVQAGDGCDYGLLLHGLYPVTGSERDVVNTVDVVDAAVVEDVVDVEAVEIVDTVVAAEWRCGVFVAALDPVRVEEDSCAGLSIIGECGGWNAVEGGTGSEDRRSPGCERASYVGEIWILVEWKGGPFEKGRRDDGSAFVAACVEFLVVAAKAVIGAVAV